MQQYRPDWNSSGLVRIRTPSMQAGLKRGGRGVHCRGPDGAQHEPISLGCQWSARSQSRLPRDVDHVLEAVEQVTAMWDELRRLVPP
jgi:hypothetical protein